MGNPTGRKAALVVTIVLEEKTVSKRYRSGFKSRHCLRTMRATHIKQFDLNLKRRFDPVNCTLDDFRSCDAPMRQCLELAWRVASTELPILILGESGTGKTMLARAMHNSSSRTGKPFVAFNAAALSETLLDSQLFGHEKGAFTGAHKRIKGKFELAHGGTLFIDEIADMSPPAQAKILRAAEYGEFERLGSEILRKADVRLISATHLTREQLLDLGFRRDLLFRLGGVTLTIPPLRLRPYDLPFLVAAEVIIYFAQIGVIHGIVDFLLRNVKVVFQRFAVTALGHKNVPQRYSGREVFGCVACAPVELKLFEDGQQVVAKGRPLARDQVER